MLVRPSSAAAHVGPGTEPSFSGVYELVLGELRITYLFPEEMFVRVFDGQSPRTMTTTKVMAALEGRIGVWADERALAPRLVSAWYTSPTEVDRNTRSSTIGPTEDAHGFERKQAPWTLVQLQLAHALPSNFESLRFRFALPETFREHANDPELARPVEAHVFPFVVGAERHSLRFSPAEPETRVARSALNPVAKAGDDSETPKAGPMETRWVLQIGLGLLVVLLVLTWPRAPRAWRPLLATLGLASAALITSSVVRGQAGLGLSSSDRAEATQIEALLRGVYGAFGRETEGEIYDALAEVVEGPVLEQLYRDIYRGLARKEHEGTLAIVRDFRLRSAQVEPHAPWSRTVHVRAEWEVHATVEHFGHQHDRRLLYRGRFEIAGGADGRPRIRGAELEDQSSNEEDQ